MPDDRTTEEQLGEILEYVRTRRRDADRDDEGLSYVHSDYYQWMATLNVQLYPQGEDTSEPAADILVNGLDELSAGALRTLERAADNPAAIACCLIQAIDGLGGEDFERAREVVREDFLEKIRAFIALLRFVRHSSIGIGGFDILSIQFDLANLFDRAIKEAMLGPMVVGVSVLEEVMGLLGGQIQQRIADTRCAPLVNLWAQVSRWLYSTPYGFISRARSFISAKLTDIRRQTHIASGGGALHTGALDFSLGAQVDPGSVDQVLDVLERIEDNLGILARCPNPDEDYRRGREGRRPGDDDDRRDDRRRRGPEDDPSDNEDDGRRGGDDRRDESGDEEDRRRGGRSPGGSGDDDRGRRRGDDPSEWRRGEDPDSRPFPGEESYEGPYRGRSEEGRSERRGRQETGRSIYDRPDGYQPRYEEMAETGDWLFLTSTNIERLLTDGLGVDPVNARQTVRRGDGCRDDLSDDALATLQELGVTL